MNINTDTPQIAILKKKVEQTIDFPLSTQGDFMRLSAGIEFTLREHMSESTLERLWGYSTRHYDNVSVRTLNVLARFAGYQSWNNFCDSLKDQNAESELITEAYISSSALKTGDRLLIGWPPDRSCIIRYMGNHHFIAEETSNSTMKPGDTFSCMTFQKGRPLYMDNFCKSGSCEKQRYIAGSNTGLTILSIIDLHGD